MLIIKKILNGLTNNCKRGWRYDEGSCFFNTKCGLSLILAVNFFTALTLVLGKQKVISTVFFINKSFPYLLVIVPVSIFLLLSLFYPKKQVLSIATNRHQEKKTLIIFLLYIIVSIGLLLISSLKD